MDVNSLSDNLLIGNNPKSMERDRAIRLFKFLTELAQLRSKTIRSLTSYEKVLWFEDIPQERECECIAWYFHNNEKEPEIWVSVQQPKFMPPPKIPVALEKWVFTEDIRNSSIEYPKIQEKIVEQNEFFNEETSENEYVTVILELSNFPELQQIWETYIHNKWKPWAQEDRRLTKIQNIYKDLYTIYQKQQRLSETYEVVISIGYLSWLTPSEQEVKRHILTAQTSMDFDSKRGVISISIAGEGAKLILETDMLEASERPGIKELNEINEQVNTIKDLIWSKEFIEPVLKSFVHSISDKGFYNGALNYQRECNSEPIINFAPAIVLRKRGERSLIQLFKEIENQLKDDEHLLPEGVIRLVSIVENQGREHNGSSKKQIEDNEIYFPLLANNNQREIVQKINHKNGVLVQGPPGTGKSHTIANLICHLLAKGQRVLVTSHTKRALEVLQDKIPSNISALCVSLLGNDQASLKRLEHSVDGINSYYSNWDSNQNKEKINYFSKKLDEARRNESSLLKKIVAIREVETYKHNQTFKNYKGTLKNIAEQLKQNEERYSWIGNIDFNEETINSPLTNQEMITFLKLLSVFNSKKIDELNKQVISIENIPEVTRFIEYVVSEKEAYEKLKENNHYQVFETYEILSGIEENLCSQLLEVTNELFISIEKIINHRQPFTKQLIEDMLADHDRRWKSIYNITSDKLKIIEKLAYNCSELEITGINNKELLIVRNDAEDLLNFIHSGNKIGLNKYWNSLLKKTNYLYNEVRVQGRLCDNLTSLQALIDWIEVYQEFIYLKKNWTDIIEIPQGTLIQQLEDYKDIMEPLEESLKIYEQVEMVKSLLDSIPGFEHPIWHKPEEIKLLVNLLKSVKLNKDLQNSKRIFNELENQLFEDLKNNSHQVMTMLHNSIKERNIEKYKHCFETISDIENQRIKLKCLDEIKYKIKSKLPYLLDKIYNDIDNNIWGNRFENFEEAWEFAQVDSWLKKQNDPAEYERLKSALKAEQNNINKSMLELSEQLAWKHCLNKMTETQRHHLIAWSQDVKNIGKGTGKHASQHRENARKNMNHCRDVIPAWIMPIYRIAETILPGEEIFDVCIIDEASQSGPEALFLYYLAKKIIVVGDDKQISPKFIGIKEEDVNYLRSNYLSDIPLSESFGINRSFFDQSAIRFGDTVRLVEHFRCMPEIIQFSNNLCYSSEPLIPVRQFGADRLEPVKTTFLKEGYVNKTGSNSINIPEAEAIAIQIADCCQDPNYEGKTIGVISLLGEAQAKKIESLLLELIGAELIEERKLICGDAYDFQGDERNIIFLSMVSAPSQDSRIGVLTREDAQKRFNVAVSRAQDQLWLFHSVTLNDLSNKCLRHQLLSYCQDPKIEPIEYNNEEVLPDVKHSDFDSLFEQRVFLKIVEKGYRVVPQYEIAGYKVDLMVFGMRGRLAVECDGDEFHTPENYSDDMARQRDLERYGLKFWRIRGSEFYRDPNQSLESLWATLRKQGIDPELSIFDKEETSESNITDNENEMEVEDPDFEKYETDEEYDNVESLESHPTEKVCKEAISINLHNYSSDDLKEAIIQILEGCPNNSCTKESLTKRVCSYFGIITRGKPRQELEKQIFRALKILIQKEIVEEYKAVNQRIRLLEPKNIIDIEDINEDIRKIMDISFDTWFEIAHWAKENNFLESYQRGIAYSLGKLAKNKIVPSEKQAYNGLIIVDEAKKLGFSFEDYSKND